MSGAALAVPLAVVAGIAGAMQVPIQGELGERIGAFGALAISTLISALLSAAILLAVRGGFGAYGEALRQPVWLLAGGAMGVVVVLTITITAPRIGTTATIGLLIAGQLGMGAVIDRFGLLGLERVSVGWPRILGIVLLAVGAALSLKK